MSEAQHKQQSRFFSGVANYSQVIGLFDHLPAVYFFVKDRRGRFMRMNRTLCEVLGVADEHEVIGKTDYDLFSQDLADRYREEDELVMSTGQTIPQRVWLVPDLAGVLHWYVSTKTPLFNRKGATIGIAGAMQDIEQSGAVLAPYQRMQQVIEYVTAHYSQKITIDGPEQPAH